VRSPVKGEKLAYPDKRFKQRAALLLSTALATPRFDKDLSMMSRRSEFHKGILYSLNANFAGNHRMRSNLTFPDILECFAELVSGITERKLKIKLFV